MRARRPEGELTRGTTAPNRLRRMDRWIAATQHARLRDRPLVVDLGYGASPITAVELFARLRPLAPGLELVGLEIDPARVALGRAYLDATPTPGLTFARGGFELPTARRPALVRAANVLRQYDEAVAWKTWDRLLTGIAPGGALVEGTCDEIGRRHVWVCLPEGTITFAADVAALPQPSALAERLPKTLIHRNRPGERVHDFLHDFDRAWAAAPRVFGARRRWIAAVELLAGDWPVFRHPPYGGRRRWGQGDVTLPFSALDPREPP
ncbi:MAG: class I SAM-dependent methyltransferase [Streptosporangiaceae bacterium]